MSGSPRCLIDWRDIVGRPYNGPYKGMTRRQTMVAIIRKYPGRFYATHPTPGRGRFNRADFPDPTKVTHTFSGVLEYGTRIWAFDTEEARNAFTDLWPRAQKSQEPQV